MALDGVGVPAGPRLRGVLTDWFAWSRAGHPPALTGRRARRPATAGLELGRAARWLSVPGGNGDAGVRPASGTVTVAWTGRLDPLRADHR